MKKKLLIMSLAVVLICSMAGVGTMAWYTSQSQSTNNTFEVGSLILGGVIDGNDVQEEFATVTFDDMEPGEPPEKIQTTKLKNVGSLPFYLYRITASGIEYKDAEGNTVDVENNPNAPKIDDVLLLNVTIGGESVYDGRLSQMVGENGGYFDPIYDVDAGEEKNMVITAYMDQNAGDEYQGLSMICDLTVYAMQNDAPVQGEPTGTHVDMGSTSSFSVDAYNSNNYVNFDWDWDPNDSFFGFEYYAIDIKHETGDTTTEIEELRVCIFRDEQVISTDGIDESDVWVDWQNDIVHIKRSALPSDWDGFEVRLSGEQDDGSFQTIPYQYWSLDRE